MPTSSSTWAGATPARCAPRSPWPTRCWCRCSRAASTRSEEHTSELQSLMRISYAVFCLKKKKRDKQISDIYGARGRTQHKKTKPHEQHIRSNRADLQDINRKAAISSIKGE